MRLIQGRSTVGEALAAAVARLRESGSESALLDAQLLLAHVLHVDRTVVLAHPDAPLGDGQRATYEHLVARRATGEPVAYIRGVKEFRGLPFAVDRRALIPRPETELMVDAAHAHLSQLLTGRTRPPGAPPVRVADVGTGSGAIAIALAVELSRSGSAAKVRIVATDISPDALRSAIENAVAHGVADVISFIAADLLGGEALDDGPPGDPTRLGDPFDLVLANLPYIPSAAVPRLPVAASFEPRVAVDGGPDGLREVRRLLEQLPRAVAQDGIAMLEIGSDQHESVAAAVSDLLPGWQLEIREDLSGHPRLAVIGPRGR